MAEPISSVVTLTTFTLCLIRETAIFIREAKEVDVRIQKLLSRLLDVQNWVEMIESTCETAEAHNETVPRCVSDSLLRCQERLKGVRDTLEGLASRKSGTFYQKVKLNIRTESSKRDVLEAIDDLKHHKSHIKSCMELWTHQRTANIDRRTSEARPTPRPAAVSHRISQVTETQATRAAYRTLSNASTILEPVFADMTPRSPSLATNHSRHSQSSASSSALRSSSEQSEDSSSSTTILMPAGESEDPVDLHSQIRKYKNDETRTQVVRQILERHPRSNVLANTKDEYGRTPLCHAAQLGDIRLARTLVEFSADINARDSQPCSVLDHALAQNKESFVAFLLEHGVNERNIMKKNRGRLEEIKEAIEYRRKKLAKQKGKGKSKKAFGTATTTRILAT